MAEASLLWLIIGKITGALAEEAVKWTGSVVAEEVKLLSQVRSRMSQIKSEFEVIQAFLNYTDAWKDHHPVLEAWVQQVRELAFDVEDTIDEYTHLLGKGDRGNLGFLPRSKAFRQSRNLGRWQGIASHLEEILKRLHHLRDMKDRYGILTSRGSDNAGLISGERRQNMAQDAHFIGNNGIVGFEDVRQTLVGWLTSEGERRPTIISVWGMAGLGKTTLVTNVYHEVKGGFSCHAWVTVSQIYRPDDLLRKIRKELLKGTGGLAVEGTDDNMDHKDLVGTLQDILRHQRYLIVLDDVWSTSVWADIRNTLDAVGNSGSKIVLTTRDERVASLAAEEHRKELQPLSEDKALELLSMKAFPRDGGKEFPRHLKDVATMIVQKCGRLPLAIVSLGSLLSLRKKEESEWKKVIDGLDWELSNNPELDQLKSALLLSYRDLPNYLKHCFLYCSIFPDDYYMRRKRLIRLWIAEGFVQTRRRQTLEDVAEDNLNTLVYRCLLQAERNDSGRVKFCRMHDMMRELVLSLSEREGFCHVYQHAQRKLEGNNRKIRRLSVHSCGEENEIRNVNTSHLRSLLLFKPAKLGYKSFKLLRVLDLKGSPLKRLPDAVWDLFNLHYLSLRSTEVNTIPSSLERLIYLQTLDLAFTKIKKLPSTLSKLTHLRNLFVHTIRDFTTESYNYFSGFPAPNGIWNLENLHTLQGVEANNKMVGHLENMVQLRSFRIIKVRAAHRDKLCAALKKMENLHRLDIVAATERERDELALGDLSPPPPCLQKLTLRGRLKGGVLPGWFCHVRSLTWVRLGWSGLSQDPLPCLQTLPNLVFLLLLRAYDGEELCFKEGFTKLRDLRLADMINLERVQISTGALQSLRQLNLVRCSKLKELPHSLRHLTTLEAVFLEDMPRSLQLGELQGDHRIRRLPSTKAPRVDGKWFGQQPASSSQRGRPLENRNDEGDTANETEGQGNTD